MRSLDQTVRRAVQLWTFVLSCLFLSILCSPSHAQEKVAGGDIILYDGEPGSAPLLGGNWAVGENGVIWRDPGSGWTAIASPVTGTLRAVASSADLQVWAAGDHGALLHLDPATLTWRADPSPTDVDLTAISASAEDNVWAAGKGGTVLTGDGESWTTRPTGVNNDLHGIIALDNNYVWAVGDNGLALFYDGSAWSSQPTGTSLSLRAIHGLAGDDLWAAGDAGTILHWDGGGWSTVESHVASTLHGLWAAESDEVWAVGEDGLILHWDGNDWTRQDAPVTTSLYAVHGLRDSLLRSAGAGGRILLRDWQDIWTAEETPGSAAIYGLSARNDSCLHYLHEVAGQGRGGGAALELTPDPWHGPAYTFYCGDGERRDFTHYDVLEFYFRSPEVDPGNPAFHLSTWNHNSETVRILDHIDGGLIDNTWRRVRIPLNDLATADWSLGNVERLSWNKDEARRIYYVDDIALRDITPPQVNSLALESNTVLRITLSERYDAVAVRNSQFTLNHSQFAIPSDLGLHYRIQNFGNSGEAINRYDILLRFDEPLRNGQTYTLSLQGVADVSGNIMPPTDLPVTYDDTAQRNPNIKVNQVGYRPDQPKIGYVGGYLGDLGGRAWVVGDSGQIWRWDNRSGWTAASSPVTSTLRAVVATRPDDAWAVGDRGAILHWDGQAWTETTSPTGNDLLALAAGPTRRLWAAGADGVSLHYTPEAGSWQVIVTPVTATLRGVWAGWTWNSPDSGVESAWAVGDNGVILRWDGAAWVEDEHPTEETLHAINGPDESWLWAAGDNGVILRRQYGHWDVFGDPLVPSATRRPQSATPRAIAFDYGGGIWIGGDAGQLWHKEGFGDGAFVQEISGSSEDIHALTRFHGRQLWGAGANGLLLDKTDDWIASQLGQTALHGLFALPYGPLRLPDPPPDVTILPVEPHLAAPGGSLIRQSVLAMPPDPRSGGSDVPVTLSGAATPAPQQAGASEEFRPARSEKTLTVPLILRAANWHLSGEDVYAFDFSVLTIPGVYQAYVPGLGLSDPFTVSHDALDIAAYTTARGFYYQRCGAALETPFADPRFARPLDHEYDPAGRIIDAAYHASLPGTPLYAGEIPGDASDAHGGWHDAGDYGKYMPTAASALWYLFTAYDMAPTQFLDRGWRIPESGNALPDLLDEARWELDWIARIQAADGGVYHKVTAQCWFAGAPYLESEQRFIFERTTHDTALAAALFASAARLWRDLDPSLAADYLSRAELAWTFLQGHPAPAPAGGFTNPADNCTGEYNDPDDSDNRLWAAAELYRTTGQASYRQYFDDWWAANDHTWGWHDWMHHYKRAYWAYLRAEWLDADLAAQDEIRASIISSGETLLARTYANPYLNGARLDVPDWIGWGAFTQSSTYAFPLLQAWFLSRDERYRAAAYLNLDTQLGANPLALSFITGLGARYPQHPLHKPSIYDDVEEPVPGIPVFGVFSHMSNGQPYYNKAQHDDNNYPPTYDTLDPYPILRRFTDASELVPMTEFTIQEMSIAAGVLGLLAQPLGPAPADCPDLTGDGQVTVLDIQAVAGRWNAPARYLPRYDIVADAVIDVQDIMAAAVQVGETCDP